MYMNNITNGSLILFIVEKRMEKINMKKLRCQAKVIGTIVTVAGATVMTLYKGPVVEMVWTKHASHHHRSKTNTKISSSEKDWFIGSIFVIISTLAWASLFVLQAKVIETYKNHQLSLTSLICFIGMIQATVVTFLMEHKTSVWSIGWDMNLLAAAYSGVFASSMSYYVQGLVMEKKGPVFATAFSPLMMIIVAIMGSFILSEQIYLGGVVGAILIIIGLYSVLWGKNKEQKQIMENKVTDENISLPIKCAQIDEKNSNQNAEAANKISLVAIDLSLPNSHMNVINQEEKF
ncbi:hypothetical protein PIB30_020476 [Stylosanthes scabra]|uniref:WAT1-related protein n=1 Tax=Stylosanthes scabra TaxID=79078 RepID=A0ABU6VAX9_9FABA|nr:hypothetical protein [Stylosanthes scabra]